MNNIELAKQIENDLIERFGIVLGAKILAKTLSYASIDALRQSIVRKTNPIPVFKLPNRRGYFALTKDVAEWLASQYGSQIK